MSGSITDVAGVRLGHWHDEEARTGCTVVVPPPGTTGAVHVAGGAPATAETDALAPGGLVTEVHAVVLTGGSAFGLASADGVRRALEAAGAGFDAGVARVPIVAAAAIFDLGAGDPAVRPGPAEGAAALAAATETERRRGAVGAGMGATVGKWAGASLAARGGLGGASASGPGGLVVAAVAVVNAVGDVVGEDGSLVAGARVPPGTRPSAAPPFPGTTIVCVATNAALTKPQAHRLAVVGSGGIARAVRPAFLLHDGDTVFALATGAVDAPAEAAALLAADVVAAAVRDAVAG